VPPRVPTWEAREPVPGFFLIGRLLAGASVPRLELQWHASDIASLSYSNTSRDLKISPGW